MSRMTMSRPLSWKASTAARNRVASVTFVPASTATLAELLLPLVYSRNPRFFSAWKEGMIIEIWKKSACVDWGYYSPWLKRHMTEQNITSCIQVKLQRNLKSKVKYGRTASCHQYFCVSLSVMFFILPWPEDVEEFNVRCHFSANASTT